MLIHIPYITEYYVTWIQSFNGAMHVHLTNMSISQGAYVFDLLSVVGLFQFKVHRFFKLNLKFSSLSI